MEKFQQQILEAGLAKHWPVLSGLVRHSIRLHTTAANESELRIGLTKIGGQPDLPKGMEWPTETIVTTKTEGFWIFKKEVTHETKMPLSFIAQVNFAETREYDRDGLLPQSGILYVFYAAEQDAWGFSPLDTENFRIIFQEDMRVPLAKRDFPEELVDYARYEAVSVQFESEYSLPSDHPSYRDFTDSETDLLYDFLEKPEDNRMLGYANEIQGSMEWDCELVRHGLDVRKSAIYQSPEALALQANAKDWILLLQIDSIDAAGMQWGDAGRLYFWIKRDDLTRRDFSKCWFALQCY